MPQLPGELLVGQRLDGVPVLEPFSKCWKVPLHPALVQLDGFQSFLHASHLRATLLQTGEETMHLIKVCLCGELGGDRLNDSLDGKGAHRELLYELVPVILYKVPGNQVASEAITHTVDDQRQLLCRDDVPLQTSLQNPYDTPGMLSGC